MSAPVRHTLPTWPIWLLLTLAVLVVLRSGGVSPRSPSVDLPPSNQVVQVRRAVDGDTLLLESGQRIRLIGVDTPETRHPDRPAEPWGAEASAFTAAKVARGEVRLQYDRERLDPYRRILAYVYVDGELLNEELIRAGLSPAVTSFPFRSDLQRRFRNAEQEARSAQRGIWSVTSETPAAAGQSH